MTTIAATAATGGGVAPTGLSGCRSEGVGPVAEPVAEPVAPPLRRLIGEVLRRVRQAQGRTLRDVAAAARVSMPYLSEVERGRKEASSEVLAAICRALNIRLVDLLAEVMTELARYEPLPLKGTAPTAPMAPSEARGALVATEPEVVAATPITAHPVAVHPVALSSAAAHRMGTGPSVALGGLGALGAAYAGLNVHVVVARPGRAARRVAGRHRRAFPLRPAARPGPARVIRPSGRPSSRVRCHPRGAGPEDGPAGMACGTVAAEPSRHRR